MTNLNQPQHINPTYQAQAVPNQGRPHAPVQSNAVFAEDRREQLSDKARNLFNAAGSDAFRKLMMAAGAFTLFFLAISYVIVNSNRTTMLEMAKNNVQVELEQSVDAVSERLDAQIDWINNGLTVGNNGNQIVNVIARGRDIARVALIDADHNIIAGTPNAQPLAQLRLGSYPQTGVIITSLKGDNGALNPVIVQKAGDAYLLVALRQGSLVSSKDRSLALVEHSGRVIDSASADGKVHAANYFDIPADRLKNLMRSTDVKVTSLKTDSGDMWLASKALPSSSLSIVKSNPKSVNSNWQRLAFWLGSLLAGMAALIYLFYKYARGQLNQVLEHDQKQEISQQRFKAAIQGNGSGIWEINLTTNEAYVSPTFAQLTGLPEHEHIMPVPDFLNLFDTNFREKFLHMARRAHMAGSFQYDLKVARLPLTLSMRGQPLTRGEDNMRIVLGIGMDVTEQIGAQARLEAAEARLHDALSSMNDSFVIWSPRDQLILWNNRFEDFFGFAPGVLTKGLDHATVEYNANRSIEEIYDHGANGKEVQLKDGRWIRYLETSTLDGGRVSIGTDVTAIRIREHQLQQNETALQRTIDVLRKSQSRIVELAESYEQEKIRAEQASQSKSEFLANMSHELRTPLNAINGFSDIMKKEMFGPLGDQRYKEYVNDILFSGQHLLSLINDILDMSKIEAGKMNLNPEPISINDLISQVLRIVRGRADDNRLKLIYNEVQTPEILADQRNVKQILLNLVTNAIKFTPEGGSVTVNVSVKSAGQIISVTDTGIGISEEDIKRLAQPFEQIDSQHSRKHEGTGLGLALSKSLVEMHGGNFKMESVVGQGTTVTFTLPNKPIIKKKVEEETEVADEFSKLAQDIAQVLSNDTSNPNQDQNPTPQVNPTPDQTSAPLPGLPPMPAAAQPASTGLPNQTPNQPNPYAA